MDKISLVVDIILCGFAWYKISDIWKTYLAGYISRVNIAQDFWKDFGKVLFLSSSAISIENIKTLTKDPRWTVRSQELFVAFSSLAYFATFVFAAVFPYYTTQLPLFKIVIFIFAIVFFVGYNVKTGWKKTVTNLGSLVLWLGIFLANQGSIGSSLAKIAFSAEPPEWIFWLSQSYFAGALYGFLISFFVSWAIKKSGFTGWLGLQGVLSGTMSLSMGWGIIIGDLCGSYFWDLYSADRNWKMRAAINLAFGFIFVLMASEFQTDVQEIFFEATSSLGRFFLLIIMATIFWMTDFLFSVVVFHFKHQLGLKIVAGSK